MIEKIEENHNTPSTPATFKLHFNNLTPDKIRIFRNLKDGKEHPFEPKVEYPTSINTKYAVVLNVTDTYIFKSSTRANLIVYLNADGTKHNYIKGEELGASANDIISARILEGNQPIDRNMHYVNNYYITYQ